MGSRPLNPRNKLRCRHLAFSVIADVTAWNDIAPEIAEGVVYAIKAIPLHFAIAANLAHSTWLSATVVAGLLNEAEEIFRLDFPRQPALLRCTFVVLEDVPSRRFP